MVIFGRHRVRASFYHIGALLFVGITLLNFFHIVNNEQAYWLTAGLFVIDYIAEMYDPHPDNPGPWFKSHFHRFTKNDEP